MAVEADVLDELKRLRTRVPLLTGSLAASVDGLVLAQDLPDAEPEGLAALTAAALGVAHRMAEAADRGDFCELLVRGSLGYVATYSAGPTTVLTLLADDRANVGRLHLEGRRSGTRIAEVVEQAASGPAAREEAAARPRPAAPGEVRALGTLPVRSPGRPRARPRPETGG
ncbi:roadblock/LC7 domain-containing protein [Streptomyces sp. NPDC090306]|uniref:roadblock/LC7 domain-containing protein n=1 Tax=unclassified Streptomyces TaxID=2593676 RepID=UPI0036E2C015